MFNLLKNALSQPAPKTDPEFAVKSEQELADMAKPLVEQLSRIASEFARRGYEITIGHMDHCVNKSGIRGDVEVDKVVVFVTFSKRETKSFSV